jgi:hypothetical protein
MEQAANILWLVQKLENGDWDSASVAKPREVIG